MKYFALVSALFSASAFAASELAFYPTIDFGPMSVTVDQLCVDGDQLRAGHRDVCVGSNDDGHTSGACAVSQSFELKTPIVRSFEECVAWDASETSHQCLSTATREVRHSLSYNVPVYDGDLYASESGALALLYTKQFTIPACK